MAGRGALPCPMDLPTTAHRIVSGDARDLAAVADESVHLVVTSPPYPMIAMWDEVFAALDDRIGGALSAQDGPQAWALMHEVLDEVWRECRRVVVPGGFVCINIGDATRSIGAGFRLYTNAARITSAMESLGFSSLPPVIWRKQTNAPNKFMGSGMLPAGAYVTLEHEYVLVFRLGGGRSFGDVDKARRRRSAYFWEERNLWFCDLWDFKGARQRLESDALRSRSGAFPLELAYRLVCMFSLQEDLVIDPFLGTGTTSLAAVAAGRSSIGYELDPAMVTSSGSTLGGSAGRLATVADARLAAHAAFVESRLAAGGKLAYRNAFHDTPVVTRQEVDLRIPAAVRVEIRGAGEWSVSYRQASIETGLC